MNGNVVATFFSHSYGISIWKWHHRHTTEWCPSKIINLFIHRLLLFWSLDHHLLRVASSWFVRKTKNKNKPDKEFFWDDRKWTLSEGISRHLSNKSDLETSQSICVFDGFYENLEEIEWMNLIESQIVSPMTIFLLMITKVLDAWTNLSSHVKTMI